MLKALLAKVFLENLENEPFGTHRCPQYHANFLFKLAIKINNIQSIKTASATKGKWSDFSFPFLGTISPKEHHCWYQYILGQLITKIIHDPWLSGGQCCRYKVGHAAAAALFTGRRISVPVFQLGSEKLSLSVKFCQNCLIDWAQKGRASRWTAASKTALSGQPVFSSKHMNIQNWMTIFLIKNEVLHLRKLDWKRWRLTLWRFLDSLIWQSNAKI